MRTALIDERLFENCKNRFPSWCTILDPNQTRNEFNELVEGTPTPLVGHEAIRCLIAYPTLRGNQDSQETRMVNAVYLDLLPQVNLDAYYPGILTTHTAQIDGVDYNIRSVIHNSTKNLTKLRVENLG